MAADVTMNDMDTDFSMDPDVDPEIARLQAEAEAITSRVEAANVDAMNGVEEEKEEGEIDSYSAAPTKVHIRGVDRLNTLDLQKFAEEHCSTDLFNKVQWIDDSSANLIYDTEMAATEALQAFSAEEAADPLQLRQAKRLSTHPDSELHVRQAIVADMKAPGAKDRSAFYLFNKDWDPDNPENIRPNNRKRRRADDDYGDRKYRRRDYEVDRHHTQSSRAKEHFYEDMYGDDIQVGDEPRRTSYSSDSSARGRRQVKYDDDEDLFARKETGRLRNRSASPMRDGDGRYGFPDEQPRRPTAKARSRTPPRIRQSMNNRSVRDKLRKELFPDRRGSTALNNGQNNNTPIELVPNGPSTPNPNRELFRDRQNGSVHRRRAAKHIHPDEVADAIGKYTIDGTTETHTYSQSGRRPDNAEQNGSEGGSGGRDLFSRINGGPKIVSDFGRLHNSDAGYNFKGAGRSDDGAGFSILGASRERAANPLVKELFPVKVAGGNAGNDLFDGRIKGRAAQRRRAEDLF